MKKKLLIDVNSIVPYYVSGKVTGIGRTTLEFIQALAKVEDLPFEIMLYSQNMKGIGGRNTGLSFKNKHLYIPHRENWDRLLGLFPVKECLARYDMMHVPHNFEYVYRPEKCILTLHDALFMKMQEKAFGHEKMKMMVPPLARECKHIITCSEASKRDIIETMQIEEEKISVIYWGVKHEQFYPVENKSRVKDTLQETFFISRPYFLSVSCNAERKRTDVLLKSYLEFCNSSVEHDLVLVWNHPPQELKRKVEERGLTSRVHFIGNVSDTDLALLYNGATALFFPSAYEGFGLPVLESMACGLPVVTCRNSSLDEIAGRAAIYVDEPINESMIEVMRNLENKVICLDSFVEMGLRRASQFTWEKTANQMVELYTKMLKFS